MTRCTWQGCAGTVDETGFCDTCGRLRPGPDATRPARPPAPRAAPANSTATAPGPTQARSVPASTRTTPASTRVSGPGTALAEPDRTSSRWTIAGLVSLPALRFPDPTSRIITDPQVPEPSRVCGRNGCRAEVGRGYAGQPALTEGFCPRCGTPFSFSPKLGEGDLVGGKYEVLGCLARGGLGWVYLAWDTHIDTFVVLKGLINTHDSAALEVAVSEKYFLRTVDHPNIVRILDFVTHQDPRTGEQTGYIVMEYLKGMSLRELQRAVARGAEQLPLEHIVGYGHEILAALSYLHNRGLLYCDMKPDNVIRCADRIKLIDLGGVRRLDDHQTPLVGTRGFQVDRAEIAAHGLSVRSDLYAVGRTLETLFHAGGSAPPAAAGGAGPRPAEISVESFRRLVSRATDKEFHRRFSSAEDMAEQLTGVLREILSIRQKKEHPERSRVFKTMAALLDAGLGTVPPLDRWTRLAPDDILADGRPAGPAVAAALPEPQVDPDDPGASFLATVRAPDARSLIDKLSAFEPASPEVALCACRANLELGEVDEAASCLASAEQRYGARAGHEWRVAWHRGLLALAHQDIAAAQHEFDRVYGALPGEIMPKLALGYCAEQLSPAEVARRYYEAVWRRDRAHVSAAFGLARICLASGDRAGAVAILDEVPRVSRHFDAARIAAVRVHSARLATGLPTTADLAEAVRRLPGLHLDGGEEQGDARDRLTTAIQEVALAWITTTGGELAHGSAVLGDPPSERAVRTLLETSFRKLARQARTVDDHGVLVDLANRVRPRTGR